MRLLSALVLAASISAGCQRTKPNAGNFVTSSGNPTTPSAGHSVPQQPLIVTPGAELRGRIALVDANLGYVVVTFGLGSMPAVERRLGVYRNGLKVGEIKITGMRRENNTVADIVAGECHVGDDVREN